MFAYVHVGFVSYTGGLVAGGAFYVSHGFQDVEGHKSDLVEAITTLPPALGGFDHLSDGGADEVSTLLGMSTVVCFCTGDN